MAAFHSPAYTCAATHTRYQPGSNEWRCPKCGAEYPKFRIDGCADGAVKACGKLHAEDDVVCLACGGQWSGEEVIKLIKEVCNLVTCPCCHGKGVIKQ